MKKFLFVIFIFTLFLTGTPQQTLAATSTGDYRDEVSKQAQAFGGTQGANLGEPRDPRLVVAYVIQILLGLLGVLFLGYTLYAGFLILTSRGEEDKITKGKDTLRTAVIGMIIILSAYSITLLGARIASGGRSDQDKFFRDDVGDSGFRDPGAAIHESGNGWEVQVNQDPSDFYREDPLE